MYTTETTKGYIADPNQWALANLATSYILVTMFIFILAAAHPVLSYHVALATFWKYSIFLVNQYCVRIGSAIPGALPYQHA
jgi:hypothetical protein